MTRKKNVSKKKERNKLCYGSNESPYVFSRNNKREKKTAVTTTKKISQLLKCNNTIHNNNNNSKWDNTY